MPHARDGFQTRVSQKLVGRTRFPRTTALHKMRRIDQSNGVWPVRSFTRYSLLDVETNGTLLIAAVGIGTPASFLLLCLLWFVCIFCLQDVFVFFPGCRGLGIECRPPHTFAVWTAVVLPRTVCIKNEGRVCLCACVSGLCSCACSAVCRAWSVTLTNEIIQTNEHTYAHKLRGGVIWGVLWVVVSLSYIVWFFGDVTCCVVVHLRCVPLGWRHISRPAVVWGFVPHVALQVGRATVFLVLPQYICLKAVESDESFCCHSRGGSSVYGKRGSAWGGLGFNWLSCHVECIFFFPSLVWCTSLVL